MSGYHSQTNFVFYDSASMAIQERSSHMSIYACFVLPGHCEPANCQNINPTTAVPSHLDSFCSQNFDQVLTKQASSRAFAAYEIILNPSY